LATIHITALIGVLVAAGDRVNAANSIFLTG
jgi:hypothetical protein